MKKSTKIKKVAPLGILLRILGFIIFLYSMYQFRLGSLVDQKFYIYNILYIFSFSYIIIRTSRNFIILNRNLIFRAIVIIITLLAIYFLADGMINFLLSSNQSLKKMIYGVYMAFLTGAILLVEYSFFILNYSDYKKRKNKRTD
ncbi:hypothetical protein GOQ27_01515 [Clostridium sp. D2Q-11]|uniref:Uncharacterized protein n=1 Tax=Anaeromonas frigoriresistens TaxID=2683708 RepID=A0A942UPX4_9FIRM|nr:hypothetical protein [Anaeromonas frigoriresistens]MBS4537119.1 hypothetical protein [Anaeromonas frigoriresistens]